MPGIEPGAFHMQSERSTAELHPLVSWWKVRLVHDSDSAPLQVDPDMIKIISEVTYVLILPSYIFLELSHGSLCGAIG